MFSPFCTPLVLSQLWNPFQGGTPFQRQVSELFLLSETTLVLGTLNSPFEFSTTEEVSYFFRELNDCLKVTALDLTYAVFKGDLRTKFFQELNRLNQVKHLHWRDISSDELTDLARSAPHFVMGLESADFSSTSGVSFSKDFIKKVLNTPSLILL